MPPKKKKQLEESNDMSAESIESNVVENGNMATFLTGLEALLDRRNSPIKLIRYL